MEIILFILQFSLITFCIFKWKNYLPAGISAIVCIMYLVLKCICGYGYYLLCVHYYSGSADLFQCMHEVAVINKTIRMQPELIPDLFNRFVPIVGLEQWNNSSYNIFYNDNRTLIFLNSLIMFISGGFISIHVLWMNVISIAGFLFIYDALNLNKQKSVIRFLPFLFPTVLIFGSSVMKEPLLLFAIGFMLKSLKLLLININGRSLTMLVISILLFLLIKIYFLIFMIPGIIAIFILNKKKWNISKVFFTVYILFFILILITGEINSSFNLPEKLCGQQLNNIRNAVFSGAQTYISPVLFAPTISSFMKRIPEAFAFGFLRPFPWELKEWWMIPVSLEPIVVLLIFIRQLIKNKPSTIKKSPVQLLCMITSVLLITLLGFITPVAGNLVRLRMPAMLLIAISLIRFDSSEKT